MPLQTMQKLAVCMWVSLLTTTSPVAQVALDIGDYAAEPSATIEGRNLPTLANEWWMWAYSMQQAQSPVRDLDGRHCGVNQAGPVWYLAGGFGSSKISRSCTIPAQKHIFFPVINMLTYAPPGSAMTCEQAKAGAARNNNNYVQLRVSLNGSLLENPRRFRAASEACFDAYARVPAEFDAPSVEPSATDGFWILLEPLPPGKHELSFQAFYTTQESSFGDMVQNISYELTILP